MGRRGLWGEGRVQSLPVPGLVGEGLLGGGAQAHSVRRESCNSDSSPEPAAACSEGADVREHVPTLVGEGEYGEGLWGEARVRSLAVPGVWGGGVWGG